MTSGLIITNGTFGWGSSTGMRWRCDAVNGHLGDRCIFAAVGEPFDGRAGRGPTTGLRGGKSSEAYCRQRHAGHLTAPESRLAEYELGE